MIGEAPHAPAIRLQQGAAADLDDVIVVMKSAFDPEFGEAWTRSQCAGILPMSGVCLMIARDGADRAVAFSLDRSVADEAELLLIAVHHEARRRGIGRLLLDRFLDETRRQGIAKVHLEVRDGNPAIEMYRRAGFETVGRRSKYYRGKDGTLFDALTLVRPVSTGA